MNRYIYVVVHMDINDEGTPVIAFEDEADAQAFAAKLGNCHVDRLLLVLSEDE
jgi:hypothetical protein